MDTHVDQFLRFLNGDEEERDEIRSADPDGLMC